MGLILTYGPGQTPLSEEAKRGLKISTILTQGELDQFEQRNISSAIKWLRSKRYSSMTLFSDAFVRSLHQRM